MDLEDNLRGCSKIWSLYANLEGSQKTASGVAEGENTLETQKGNVD